MTMDFLDVLESILDAKEMTQKEFLDATGLHSANIDWWRRNPETVPQAKTLRKIRRALSIEFIRDPETREIVGWKPEKDPGAGQHLAKESRNVYIPPHSASNGLAIPDVSDEAAMVEQYNRLTGAYGLREKWENLTDDQRDAIRREFALLNASLKHLVAEYEQRIVETILSDRKTEKNQQR